MIYGNFGLAPHTAGILIACTCGWTTIVGIDDAGPTVFLDVKVNVVIERMNDHLEGGCLQDSRLQAKPREDFSIANRERLERLRHPRCECFASKDSDSIWHHASSCPMFTG